MSKRYTKEQRLLSMIEETGDTGRIFGVKFIKRTTGEIRKMTARLGVRKGVKGVGMSFSPASKGLVIAYEMPESRFRSIPLENILSLTVDGMTIQ